MLLIICSILILNTLVIYWADKHISIAVMNSAMWAFLSTSVIVFDLPAREKAYIFVLINIILFTVINILVKGKTKLVIHGGDIDNYEAEYDITSAYNDTTYNKLIKWVIVLNFISLLYLAYSLGFRLSTFTSLSRLMARMNAISKMRYSGDGETISFFNRLINSIVYASMAFSGFYMAFRAKIIHLINLILIIFQTIVLNTKATLVFGLAFWVGGYLTSISYQNKIISVKKALIAIGIGSCVLAFSATINFLRHKGVIPFFNEFQRIIYAYFVGPFSAFSIWFDSTDGSALDLGANTFSCVFRIFGIKDQEHGANMVLSNTAGTNVYTVFKHLVNDYSYIGTILISIVLGFTSGIIDNNVRIGKERSIYMSMVFFAIILVSFFSSLFRYTTNLVACIIIIMIPLVKRITIRGKRII